MQWGICVVPVFSARVPSLLAAKSSVAMCCHRPEETALYDVVERHQHAFFAHLEHGFVWVKCEGCRHEHLVAFSCKGRGFCPSCASRRMAETGAKLVDDVLPAVPYRQWVLSFPIALRLLFAQRPEYSRQCWRWSRVR